MKACNKRNIIERKAKFASYIIGVLLTIFIIFIFIGFAQFFNHNLHSLVRLQYEDKDIDKLNDFTQFILSQKQQTKFDFEIGKIIRSAEIEENVENPFLNKAASQQFANSKYIVNDPESIKESEKTDDNTDDNFSFGNITLAEAFVNAFFLICQQQKDSFWKKDIRVPGVAESTLIYDFFGRIFSETGGFRLFNGTEELEASNVTKEAIWRTYGSAVRWIDYAGPIVTNVEHNRFDNKFGLSFNPARGQLIPADVQNSNCIEAIKQYNDSRTTFKSAYLTALFFSVNILNYTSTISKEDIEVAAENALKFTEDISRIAAISNGTKDEVDMRKFSALQKTEIDVRKSGALSMAQLEQRFPNILWRSFLAGLLINNVTSDTRILVKNLKYFDGLNDYFGNKTNNAELLLLNLITINTPLIYLSSDMKNADCNELLNMYMPHAKAFRYVNNIPRKEREAKVNETSRIVRSIVEEYGNAMNESNWMTAGTRGRAVQKLEGLNVILGWPAWYELDQHMEFTQVGIAVNASIDRYHQFFFDILFHLTRGPFFPNIKVNKEDDFLLFDRNEAELMRAVFIMNMFSVENKFNKIGLKYDVSEGVHANMMEAAYNTQTNTVYLAYGWIDTYYNKEKPDENFWLIGFTIAHEIGHAFDTSGLLYGRDGYLVNWVDSASAEKFDEIQQCVVERYSSQCCPKQTTAESETNGTNCVNGWKTQDENIADISGLTIVYRALRNGHQNGATKRRFWFNYSVLWFKLAQATDRFERNTLADVHSPNECRVDLVLKSIPQFYIDFGEKPPEDKNCHMWNA